MNRKLAIALLVFANVMWGSSYAVAKVALEELPPPLLGALRITVATTLIWLVLLLLWYVASGTFPIISTRAILGVLYLAVVTSCMCQLVWFHVLRYTGANTAAITLFVQPLVGSLLGLLVLHEPLTAALVVGGALIFAALYFTGVPGRKGMTGEYQLPDAPVVE